MPPWGSDLRAHRLRQRLSLESIAAQTRVPAVYLQALEDGDLDRLPPAAVVVKAYLRAYCRCLALGPDEEAQLVTALHEHLDAREAEAAAAAALVRATQGLLGLFYRAVVAIHLPLFGLRALLLVGEQRLERWVLGCWAAGAQQGLCAARRLVLCAWRTCAVVRQQGSRVSERMHRRAQSLWQAAGACGRSVRCAMAHGLRQLTASAAGSLGAAAGAAEKLAAVCERLAGRVAVADSRRLLAWAEVWTRLPRLTLMARGQARGEERHPPIRRAARWRGRSWRAAAGVAIGRSFHRRAAACAVAARATSAALAKTLFASLRLLRQWHGSVVSIARAVGEVLAQALARAGERLGTAVAGGVGRLGDWLRDATYLPPPAGAMAYHSLAAPDRRPALARRRSPGAHGSATQPCRGGGGTTPPRHDRIQRYLMRSWTWMTPTSWPAFSPPCSLRSLVMPRCSRPRRLDARD